MTDQHFALFDTRIGLCAIAWGPRGINGTQLPMGGEQKIRTRIAQRHADATEAPPSAEVQQAIVRLAIEQLYNPVDRLPPRCSRRSTGL